MAKKKVCKVCKMIVAEDVEECPNCGSRSQWNTTFHGRAYVFDTKKSYIAQRMEAETKGEYAIKSRS
ncbi:MAG: transcription elongation factor subunit Spt4 [Candidatus Woesearchaeota archaeon]